MANDLTKSQGTRALQCTRQGPQAVIFFIVTSSMLLAQSPDPHQTIDGQVWLPHKLKLVDLGEEDPAARGFQLTQAGPDSVAILSDTSFEKGTVEFEFAAGDRARPELALGVGDTSDEFDRIIFAPLPGRKSGSTLRRLTLTNDDRSFVVVSFDYDETHRDQDGRCWIKVCLEFDKEICRLWIGNEPKPVAIFSTPLHTDRGKSIGVAGFDASFRNFKLARPTSHLAAACSEEEPSSSE